MFLSGMVGASSGGTEKRYKITDNSNSGFPESAYAGEIVFATEDSYYVTVVGTSKRIIPVDIKSRILADSDVSTYAGSQEPYGFVMPAEDVTIS